MPPAGSPPPPLSDYWRTLKKRRQLIGIVSCAIALGVAMIVLPAEDVYTADATLLIEPEVPRILEIPQVLGQALEDNKSYYETQYEILRSRALAEVVVKSQPALEQEMPPSALQQLRSWLVDRFRADPTPEEEFAARVAAYQEALDVQPSRDTRLVSVAFSAEDPALAARVANAHAEAYIEHGRSLRKSASRDALDFLVEQGNELRHRVDVAQAKLAAYRERHGIVALDDPLDDRPNAVLERVTELNKRLTEAENERMAREADYVLRKSGGHSLPTALESPLVANLKQDLARLESEYESLTRRYLPGYPGLEEAKAAVEAKRSQLEREIRYTTEGIESAYLAARARENALRKQLELQAKQALELKDASAEYGMLENDLRASQTLYDAVQDRIQQTDVSAQLRASNVFLLQPAQQPVAPSGPGKGLLLAAGLVLALLGSVAIALIAEQLDSRVRSSDELEHHFGLPTLGSVPDLSRRGSGMQVLPVRRLAASAREREFAGDPAVNTPLVPPGAPPQAIEAYRRLRTNILLSQAQQPPRTLLFTSAGPGEGKTTTTLNTARLFAQLGNPVLVIDADLRKADCHNMLELENTLGLTEILTGGALGPESVHRLGQTLALLTAGKRPPNPTELVGSKLMKELLASARERFDYVLIDGPPLMPVSDSVLLATMVDGVVLVADQQRTQRAQLKVAQARLGFARAKVLGTVLNRAETAEVAYPYPSDWEPAVG